LKRYGGEPLGVLGGKNKKMKKPLKNEKGGTRGEKTEKKLVKTGGKRGGVCGQVVPNKQVENKMSKSPNPRRPK